MMDWRRAASAAYRWTFTPGADAFGGDKKPENSDRRFWIVLLVSIGVAIAFGVKALQAGFTEPHTIQDDARQHVFWMRRFLQPDAFPGDLIADYFQTVAPWAYQGFYRGVAALGLDPLVFNKLLPMGLGLIASVYGAILAWMMMPVPAAAGLGAVLLQASLWFRDDLVSGTAAAFAGPLMLAVLVHGFRNQRIPLAIALLLLTGTYPQCALVMLGTLTLGALPGWWMMRRSPRETWITVSLAWAIVVAGLLPFVLRDNPYGPVMKAEEARTLATFGPKAWSTFFTDDPWNFWACGKRSGLFPEEWCRLMSKHAVWLVPIWAPLALLLPIFIRVLRRQFPLGGHCQPASRLLGQLTLASLVCFTVAHQVLFTLHLPNRYSEHSLRIVAPLAGGMVIAIILERCFYQLRHLQLPLSKTVIKPIVGTALGGGLILFLLYYPTALNAKNYKFPTANYISGVPELQEFLREQPSDIVIASLEKEADNIPALAGRSIYVGAQGYILPYHRGFYELMVDRLARLTDAQYSDRWDEIQAFSESENITHWLINRDSFNAEYLESRQFIQFDLGQDIRDKFKEGFQPVLPQILDTCSIWENEELVLLTSDCLAKQT